jgi:hypothetical protein
MGINWKEIEGKVMDGVHDVLKAAENVEPTATEALEAAMTSAGVPTAVSQPIVDGLEELINHFENSKPATTVTVTQEAIAEEARPTAPFPSA